MKKFSVMLLALVSFAPSSYAASSYVGDVGVSNKHMDVKIRDRQFEASFVSLDLSSTVLRGNWFASIAVEQSIKDDIEVIDVVNTTDGIEDHGLLFLSRQDFSLTTGYRLLPKMTVFAGYRRGLTRTYLNAQRTQGSVRSDLVSRAEIKSDGVFAGVSFNHRFASGNSLGLSAAIAKLTGSATLSDPFADSANLATIANVPDVIEGQALGLSYTLSWSMPVSNQTAINLRYKLHRYTFDHKQPFQGLDFSYRENFDIFTIDMTHRF